jgi:hypothetical protein
MGGITARRFASIWALRASVKLSSPLQPFQVHDGLLRSGGLDLLRYGKL